MSVVFSRDKLVVGDLSCALSLVNSTNRFVTTTKNRQRAGFQDVQPRRSGPWRRRPRASSRPSPLEAGWRRTRARTRSHLTSMSISIAAKVRARSAGDRCRPRPTMRLHRRNCADPDGAAGRPGRCIHRSPFGREHGAEQTECDGPRSACGRTRRMARVLTNLQCSLSRRRMVFAATRRRRTLALSEVTGGATATASSIIVTNGFPTGGSGSSAGAECSCS